MDKDTFQNITPWEAQVNTDNKTVSINYNKIISQFGCKSYTKDLTRKLEEFSKSTAHFYFSRNIVFAHRDFDILLEKMKNKKIYLYTGRGPSSESMHLGHVIPFQLCKYFQDTFKCPLVIQLTDDEKFLFKNQSLEESMKYCKENMKDIIAFGFDPDLTYIFSNVASAHLFEKNVLKISKSITLNEACKVFGFDMNSNIGMINFPSKEIAPCYASSFDFLQKGSMCLIPCAVDQDPYFRLARDKANILKEPKPTTLYVSLLPDLKGVNKKMSASDNTSSIFLTDTPAKIAKKIKKYAYSGGKETLEEHRLLGGDTSIDIPYQYLRYFHTDSSELERIKEEYEKGNMSSGEIKNICIEVIQRFVKEYQERRKNVTDEVLDNFCKKL
ncbi:tryptophanyl-tRNA ligase (WARS1) [Vairimorpha necatrix]|uniref:tryptophan--tRNA ligase n=1 Tax=Vairimorpha necatrix TaxID=6039 RepID=A0AAX4JI30_9MICR